jgi:hypothetical protein
MSALFTKAIAAKKMITYGPEHEWSDDYGSASEFEESKDPEKIPEITESFAASSTPITLVRA